MPVAIAEDSTATDGTEQTLATDTTNKTYVFVIDTAALVNGDTIEVRIKTKALLGGTERLAYIATYANVQLDPIKYSPPVPADISCKVTLKRVAGSDRTFPWKLISV
jgi:hypothetical protein